MEMKHKVGYIDDNPEQFENYERKLRRSGIKLICFSICDNKADYIDQIYRHQVDALLIDYKMAGTLGYNGTSLISYINDMVADLTCFILTAVETDKITDKLVSNSHIYSKEIFDTEAGDPQRVEAFQKFVACLKNCAEVFESRRNLKCAEYQKLLDRKRMGELSVPEEEEFRRLYRVLSSYGMVERIPEDFLTSDFEKTLNRLLASSDAILEQGTEG